MKSSHDFVRNIDESARRIVSIAAMGTTVGTKVVTLNGEGKAIPGPGVGLWALVRGNLIARGWSDFTTWCRSEQLDPKRVKHALFGLSDTDESRAMRARAMRAAGLLDGEGASK